MGKLGKEIIGIDIKKLSHSLKKAFADEWLAYYQYWLGAKITEGPMQEAIVKELEQHAKEELEHAQILCDRLIQLGEIPPLSPQEWSEIANCKYLAPTNPYVKNILEQNLEGEQCAIKTYNQLLKEVKDKDHVTYNMILKILEDEEEHEEDLESLLEDLKLGKH